MQKIHSWKKYGIAFLVVIVIVLAGIYSQKKQENVVLFSCMEESREAALLENLEEKFPELEFVLQHYSTGNCGAKLLAEGTATEADIVVGLQCASLETVKDSLADVSGVETAEYSIPALNPEHGKYWVWEKYDGAIVVNTDVLEKENLPEPKSYIDLLDPVYNQWIVMPTAKTSGAGYMFFNNWYNMWGEREAFDYLDRLAENVSQFVSSGHNVTQLLLDGENAVGLVDLMNVYRQIAEGAPLKIIIPDTGAPYNLTGTAIIRGKEKKKAVADVYTYLMGEYVVEDNSNFSPGGIFKGQKKNIAGYPEELSMANMDTIMDNSLKEYLTEKWQY